MMKVDGEEREGRSNLASSSSMSDERFTFASPLPESWLLLLIISRHHAGISIAATHGHLRLLLLLLLRHVEAIHVALLAARVEIIILLISIHVLLDELVR